jgi:hypothetical protein
MICYRLNKELSGQKILEDVQKLINKNNNNGDLVLVICVKEITNYSGDSPMLKIEYKP